MFYTENYKKSTSFSPSSYLFAFLEITLLLLRHRSIKTRQTNSCTAYCTVLSISCFSFLSATWLHCESVKPFPWRQQLRGTDSVVNTQQLNCACVWSQEPARPAKLVPLWLHGFPLPPPPLTHSSFHRLTVAFLPAPSSRRWASCTPLFPPQRRPNRRWVFSTWLKQTHLCSGWGDVCLTLCESY